MKAYLRPETRSRRVLFALGLYVLVTAGMLLCAAPSVLRDHTPYNHFALQAQAWLDGHLHLTEGPPGYAGNNDFAKYGQQWFVTFPAFPALLLLPLVRFAGDVESVRDGQFFIWLSGIGPAVLFLALEKLRRTGRSERSEGTNAVLSLLFAFGSVYFFTALQGTVWFAAHVVAVGLCALYILFALDAQRPVLAGLMLGLGFWTRSPLLFAFPLFAVEALRVHSREPELAVAAPERPLQRVWFALQQQASRVVWKKLLQSYALFALPIVLLLGLALWHNQQRFDDPFDFGYQYLTVAWQSRMKKWGLFHYHYLARNLGVVFSSLPWLGNSHVPFRINMHGLALWVTTPLFIWLLWPCQKRAPHLGLWLTVAAVAVPTLFYQNTGWQQFGYRFSNDYAPFLFVLLAIGGRRFGNLFWLAAAWSVGVNTFGALTFDRAGMDKFYYSQASQEKLYEAE